MLAFFREGESAKMVGKVEQKLECFMLCFLENVLMKISVLYSLTMIIVNARDQGSLWPTKDTILTERRMLGKMSRRRSW